MIHPGESTTESIDGLYGDLPCKFTALCRGLQQSCTFSGLTSPQPFALISPTTVTTATRPRREERQCPRPSATSPAPVGCTSPRCPDVLGAAPGQSRDPQPGARHR